KLAVGYTLDEIPNDITRVTKASFEPSIDYVVVKIPRFAFEKFPQTDPVLTTQMKSVGEVMSIGRTFKEALQKAVRSLEVDRYGFEPHPSLAEGDPDEVVAQIRERLRRPDPERLWHVADGLRMGISVDEIYALTKIDRWFLNQMKDILAVEDRLARAKHPLPAPLLREAKQLGFSDHRLGELLKVSEEAIRRHRIAEGITAVFKRVDTCAAEFQALTPYLYSTYESECESRPQARQKVMILGGGPNRIGQGIEFDYCCVHAAMALREMGYETIMVNCNPETVSTDYDTSDRLYFEPLTEEDVLAIVDTERRAGTLLGVVVQFGGQTPLKLALPLERDGVPILGTSPDAIDRAEDRERFRDLLPKLGLQQPASLTATTVPASVTYANSLGWPVLLRPSYVLGGRAMDIFYDEKSLQKYAETVIKVSDKHPVLVDKYLEDAIEVDVDAISDRRQVVIGGIMEHIEEAGVHSGDSACSLPPYSLSPAIVDEIRRQTVALALELKVVGLMNVQFAVKDGTVYVLEVNPRASRTVPFVSKAIGVPLAKLAMQVMMGRTLEQIGFTTERTPRHLSVKEAVFPFTKFPNIDVLLGPEMKSTGEVMGIADDFGAAFLKSQQGAGSILPMQGRVFISVKDKDKPATDPLARRFLELGFTIEATRGTAAYLAERGIMVDTVNKVKEGRPHCVDHIKNGEVALVINTVGDKVSQADSASIRRTALVQNVPYQTTMAGARATLMAIEAGLRRKLTVKPLQEYYATETKK
ncbi:MAG TPA: carbamoyl-phosphate synthase large subunit, partial [Nitrospiraceae bacterium]|nr:carbamoyl-phosphate synthase large subunit [Nitrospiraceae bacterium]